MSSAEVPLKNRVQGLGGGARKVDILSSRVLASYRAGRGMDTDPAVSATLLHHAALLLPPIWANCRGAQVAKPVVFLHSICVRPICYST